MKRMTKRLMLALTTALLLTLLTVTAYAGTIPGTAKLTITPTETKVSGDTATVTYSVTVTPPEGKALGVFSVQLQPSVGMTLAQDASGLTYGDGNLGYSAIDRTGIFEMYGYTASTGYFAAVGTTPDRRMTEEATILTIQATMPANKNGVYTLNAEFIAALDGSGDVYTAQVITTPVAISNGQEPQPEKTPVITETDGDDLAAAANTAPDGNAAGGSGKEVATDTIYGFHRVYNYNASLGINTKIYGMYNPIFLPKKKIQIRHVITPSVSISAAPDFGSSRYGYYESYIRNYADGRRDTVTYSPYSGQAFDVPGRGKQGNITFSISNNLEMKYYSSKKDTVKKVSLIDELGANISYNMAAATRPWSDLGLNLRLKLSKNYTFSMSSSFKTYGYKFDKNGNVVPNDRTEWSYGRFGIFQGYGSSFSYTFNNDTWKKWKEKLSGTGDSDKEKKDEAASEEGEGTEDGSDDTGIPKKKVEKAAVDSDGYQVFKMPWSLNFNYSFNISEDTSKPINRKTMRYPYRYTHNLSASGNIKLSNKWAVSFNSGYDFEAKKIVQTTFNITRDLHCFSMSASLSPFGQWKYYNFTIRANASILQDLKWEQRSQTQSNIQWY